MRILYVYEGPRNAAREEEVLRTLNDRFGSVSQTDSHSGEEGLTTVALEAEEERSLAVVEHLREQSDVLDAVQGSFGENA
jgi:hypothetical protein